MLLEKKWRCCSQVKLINLCLANLSCTWLVQMSVYLFGVHLCWLLEPFFCLAIHSCDLHYWKNIFLKDSRTEIIFQHVSMARTAIEQPNRATLSGSAAFAVCNCKQGIDPVWMLNCSCVLELHVWPCIVRYKFSAHDITTTTEAQI